METPVIKIRPDVEYMPPENYEPPELKIVIQDEANKKYCPHEYIKIYPHHRIIQCAECRATLDPFDHLVAVGRREGNQLSNLKYLQLQVKRLQEEEEALKKAITKLRSDKRKLNKS
jgi:hypothetical protein